VIHDTNQELSEDSCREIFLQLLSNPSPENFELILEILRNQQQAKKTLKDAVYNKIVTIRQADGAKEEFKGNQKCLLR